MGGETPESEQALSEANRQAIVVKSTTKKLKLESISPAQWIAANSCIRTELILRGKLPASQMLNYLSSTAKIGDLALRYSWLSVLYYDNEYRYFQAQYKFEWGRDAPHLATTSLRER